MNYQLCPTCRGTRLKAEALAVTILGKNIYQASQLNVEQLLSWLDNFPVSSREQIIAAPILKEIKSRLTFLKAVGLDYLTQNRLAGSLAGGEAQRIRLASQIGTGLTGVLYVLDEPSIGLHPRDNERLLETLHTLRDLGNSVLVVEHDAETIERADYVIDLGPLAGTHGGEVIAFGTPIVGCTITLRPDLSVICICLLYTSDAADDLLSVDHGGRRIFTKQREHEAIVDNGS